ncbi:hypothetical protein OSCT_3153 [Oscillochloris trichoides DG-6]|uniref:Uncharacterized protein n=1 Tax=Oscillochloris trichoides DG-6 TaxID=765420 RepID=E1IIK2_9CHLR|nr:hypothetical protein [Oscillochloris trichoides]EFO78992.1 hypothetical protein OSCT_3153 [Oscillochloris trichoides DG-6]
MTNHLPQAFAALEAFPALHAEVAPALQRQAARAVATLAHALPRPELLDHLHQACSDPAGGLVVVEGAPGTGVTSLLVALAARYPFPLWLADADPQGLAALYAQIIALWRPGLPLIDPAALTDPIALERLLTEAVATAEQPLVLLIDLPNPHAPPATPFPALIPSEIPPGLTLVLGCVPGTPLPTQPRLRLALPADAPDTATLAVQIVADTDLDPRMAQGNLLYLRLMLRWHEAGLMDLHNPPLGLNGLLGHWWQGLDASAQHVAALLAAAAEPLPLPVIAELVQNDPEPLLSAWESLELVDLTMQASSEGPLFLASLAHPALSPLIANLVGGDLHTAHGSLAALALHHLSRPTNQATPGLRYLARNLARHAALGPQAHRATRLAQVTSREWVRNHSRLASLADAQRDATWELRAAADGPILRLIRAAALTGILATRARSLDADSAVAALTHGIEQGSRDAALKRVTELVERLPDGMDKAQILRRLGETCYAARMRTSAMRLLSRALDLEANPTSPTWREQREQLFVALAQAALNLGAITVALQIAERIEHLERRAMVETQVTRHLIAAGDLGQARRVAYGVLHESMGAWARAEVGVALARAGDQRGSMILEEISLETVRAWAEIELACDLARHDDRAALARIEALPSPGQRDRGLARLAHALAMAQKDGDALAAAEQISTVESRVAALLDLRVTLDGLVAMLALERATNDIHRLTGDDRAPLLAALAAAHALIGRREAALKITTQLPEGEERDRALAKVAVAITQGGDYPAAQQILAQLDDDDERDWAKDEIARILAATGCWEESWLLVHSMSADDQRSHSAADLAIERARSGEPVAALAQAGEIEMASERARAMTLIAPLLVAAGQSQVALDPAYIARLASSEARGRYLAGIAIALAEAGHLDAAADLIRRIHRPAARARAGAALAHTYAPSNPVQAVAALAEALQATRGGREETLRTLEWAAPTLALLGGSELLAATAAVVAELDG